MSKSHRQEVEQVLGNQRDQFQQEYNEDQDDLDAVELDDQFKNDAQYKELIGGLKSDQPIIGKKSSRNLEDLPKYKGKKVTRKEMEEIDQQDLMISDSELEDDDEEEDNDVDNSSQQSQQDQDSEQSEDDNEEESEDEKPKVIKNKSNGKRKLSKELNDSEEESGHEEEGDDDDEESKHLKKIAKKLVEQKKNKTYLQDQMNVDDIIDEIDQEDQDLKQETQKQQDDEMQKAKAVRQQIQLWKELVFVRFNMHKNLELVKKLPSPQDIGGFDSKENNQNKKYLELNILRNIDLIQKIRGNLTEKANGPKDRILRKNNIKLLQKFINHNNIVRDQYENENELNIKSMWQQFEESFDNMHNWMEENILKWSQKTQLLNSINLKRNGMSALIHTPIGQTQKAMQQIDNLIYKSQLKRTSFRILGRDISNVQKETDQEIFDDSDLYHELLKEYMTEIEENKEVGEDGLLFDSTRLYLLERKLKQQEKKQKIVDRRASKSRKIRFDVHQKLVNFMNPIDNKELLEGRNEIIKCLFGKFENEEEENQQQQNESNENGSKNKANGKSTDLKEEPSLNKKRKLGSSKSKNIQNNDDDDVQLI
ncbi:apoptosis antagonizing transcription factor (macronuclear) [Tetrahymena thermophila SB210]|uniref:Apoptosis antagonizing transcription factor n=1 Tax=Tetrahymena thermophila (strain SB210) TaxID=312017 RepID=I7LT94_TETTS|nr:apoptosis antagonizing transcription factor [Tetrahymena thermophila SB210]EAR84833.2 apoptosis antagonizing transcription factor [Tetrahymena thermophila SB210]|eukprot:XP_001032496.2 apoptosis antagonizing transcription factor [Tetrahymena thermophila SB210]